MTAAAAPAVARRQRRPHRGGHRVVPLDGGHRGRGRTEHGVERDGRVEAARPKRQLLRRRRRHRIRCYSAAGQPSCTRRRPGRASQATQRDAAGPGGTASRPGRRERRGEREAVDRRTRDERKKKAKSFSAIDVFFSLPSGSYLLFVFYSTREVRPQKSETEPETEEGTGEKYQNGAERGLRIPQGF